MAERHTIRLATEADAERIHAGLGMIADHLKARERMVSTVEDIRRHGFGAEPAFTVLIAEIGGAFAGMSLFFPSFSTWRGERGAYVQDFLVVEAFRGDGVGHALLRRTATHVKRNGGTYLRLSVDAGNYGARQFYERAGLKWSRDEHIHAAYGDAFTALADQTK